jgi:hypothetical protein
MSSHQIQTSAPVRIWVRFRPIFRLFQPLREQARLPVKMDGMESNHIKTFFCSQRPKPPSQLQLSKFHGHAWTGIPCIWSQIFRSHGTCEAMWSPATVAWNFHDAVSHHWVRFVRPLQPDFFSPRLLCWRDITAISPRIGWWKMGHESPDGSVQEWSIQYQWIWGVPPFWTCLKKLPLGSLGESVKPFKSLCFCLWRNERLRGTWNDLKRCANFSTLIFGNCEDYEWKTVTKHSHPRNMPFWSVLHTFSNGSHIPSSIQWYKNAGWLGTSTVHHLSNPIDV